VLGAERIDRPAAGGGRLDWLTIGISVSGTALKSGGSDVGAGGKLTPRRRPKMHPL
jgi:hypothetical protein